MTPDADPTAVVLAAHGAPATDYPPMRVGLLMMLEFAGRRAQRIRLVHKWQHTLDHQMRTWPRRADNDPYKAAVDDLAGQLAGALGCRVSVGYNEFCAPTIDQAIDGVVAAGARRVIVVPTMLVRGNSHTELEIQETVAQARHRYPTVDIRYAWPFRQELLVSLLAGQVTSHLESPPPD